MIYSQSSPASEYAPKLVFGMCKIVFQILTFSCFSFQKLGPNATVSEAASFIFSDLQGSSISTGLGRVVGTVFGGEPQHSFHFGGTCLGRFLLKNISDGTG